MWIFARGESSKAQENVRRAREGHFGHILTVQLSQAGSQVLSQSSHPSGCSLLWFWKSQVWNSPFAQEGRTFCKLMQLSQEGSQILSQGDNIHPSINVTAQNQM